MNLDDRFSHVNNPTHYLIEKRFELNLKKLKEINEFVVSMLNRILICVDDINKKINDISIRVMNLENNY
tara:strand:+ start:1777 stop:1983 length:207 start_codon:yes stop_codon:yes gene_type:complete